MAKFTCWRFQRKEVFLLNDFPFIISYPFLPSLVTRFVSLILILPVYLRSLHSAENFQTMAPRFLACFIKSSTRSSGKNVTVDESSEEQKRFAPVLVELFTSQGCATSPTADLLLSRLGRGDFKLDIPVLVLAHHVDYWDHVGWKDPYGSSLSTVRQKAYVESLNLDTLYTPQVIVQGRTAGVGTDEEFLISSIRCAARFTSLEMQCTFQLTSPEVLQVTLTGSLRTKVDSKGADVVVALYENGIVTDCLEGENKGRVLSHDFVVRKLEKLCAVKNVPAKKTMTGTVKFDLWEGYRSTKCGIVVFVQDYAHRIYGTQHFEIPENI